jgi:D-3-phosphoglycerate dehydrogenase
VGTELRGKTLGIIGLGKIGMAVAERARAMEMSLIGSDPYVTSEAAAARGIELVEVGELLRRADVLTVHVPLLAETRGMIGADQLHLMKPGAFVINVARGGVIDEAALAEALRDGRVAGAAIDVYEHEPPRDSPLLDAPNTVLTPHLGASTREAQTKAGVEVAEQVLDALAGREPRYAVNSAGAAKRG